MYKKETTLAFIERLNAKIEAEQIDGKPYSALFIDWLKNHWQWLGHFLNDAFQEYVDECVKESKEYYEAQIAPAKEKFEKKYNDLYKVQEYQERTETNLREREEALNRDVKRLKDMQAVLGDFPDKRSANAFNLFRQAYDYVQQNNPKDPQAKQRAVTAAGNMATAYLSPKAAEQVEEPIDEKCKENIEFEGNPNKRKNGFTYIISKPDSSNV